MTSDGMPNRMSAMNVNSGLVVALVVFGTLYCLTSLVNHYNFRTYALDLGLYTNALYDYVHFRWNDSTVFKEVAENLLADHFDLYLMILSPLSLVFGTYTLLVAQIGFILVGGLGIHYFFATKHSTWIPICACIYFYAFFGVFAAVSSDYHSNVVAASMIPWLFYSIRRKKIGLSFLIISVILIGKENMSLWLVFICGGLAVEYRKDNDLRNFLFLSSGLSMMYFIIVTSFVMPTLSAEGSYPHFHYSSLGNNHYDAVMHLVMHPLESLEVLFINHNNSPGGDYVKLELHMLLLFSGLPFLFLKPQYLFMLVPIYFQKLFHDHANVWGVGSQYSIEFAPILAVGVFEVISEIEGKKTMKVIAITAVLMTILCTIRTMDHTMVFTDKAQARFYQARHYRKEYDVAKIHALLSRIPKDVILSAQSPFLPHLALRDKVYQFPIIKDAKYVVYSKKEKSYPMTKSSFTTTTAELENSEDWKIEYRDEDLTILRRI